MAERLYTASWADRRGAGGSSIPMPWEEARAWLLAQVKHNRDRWPAADDVIRTVERAPELPVGIHVETACHVFTVS